MAENGQLNIYDMKTDDWQKKVSPMMRNIFTYLMENRYNPAFEDNRILLDINGNASVLEYENAVLTLRTFFTIEEEEYDMFLEASNYAMLKSFMIKPVIMEDMKSIMFSCETFCESFGDFKRFFPKMVEYSRTGLEVHKNEMRELLKATQMLSRKNPVIDEEFIETGISSGKLLT